jgi:hypothetical protein
VFFKHARRLFGIEVSLILEVEPEYAAMVTNCPNYLLYNFTKKRVTLCAVVDSYNIDVAVFFIGFMKEKPKRTF